MPFVILFWLVLCLIFPALGFFLLVMPLAAANWLGPWGITVIALLVLGITIYRDYRC